MDVSTTCAREASSLDVVVRSASRRLLGRLRVATDKLGQLMVGHRRGLVLASSREPPKPRLKRRSTTRSGRT